jgi:hypothetical protein
MRAARMPLHVVGKREAGRLGVPDIGRATRKVSVGDVAAR